MAASSSSSGSSGLVPRLVPLLVWLALVSQVADAQAADARTEVLELVDAESELIKNRTEALLRQPERVTVLAPRQLRPQRDYHVLVNLANSRVPATVDLQLTGGRETSLEQTEAKSVLVQSGETQTVKFAVGDWPPAEYLLQVNVQAVDRSWNFTDEAPLEYVAHNYLGLIQLDKAIYKPGQLVQFRALFLQASRGSSLAPLALKNEINVTITDPENNVVKQWTGLSNYRGLLTLEMPLAEDPMLGDYLIRVEARKQEFAKQFTVAEYTLPTFDVDLQLPAYATRNDSKVVATVRATYTYGKPVAGHVTLTVQPLARYRWIETRPLEETQFRARLGGGGGDQGGKAEFEVDLGKLLGGRQQQQENYFYYGREVEFFALVEEDLTGRKYNRTKSLTVYDKDVLIEPLRYGTTFKPGLNYLLQYKVLYRDDTPVENDGPEVELKYSWTPNRTESVRLRPVNGLIEHEIAAPRRVPLAVAGGPETEPANDTLVAPTYLDVEANYRGQHYQLPTVGSFHTQSGQHLQISLPQLRSKRQRANSATSSSSPLSYKPTLSAQDQLRVRLEATEPMQQVTCQGLARGDIVWATSADARNRSWLEFEVKLDDRMAPELLILCFYIRPQDKELISDMAELQVSGTARNFVKLSASRAEVKPGQEVEVDVFTRPSSLVGVLAVDESVLLLKSGNDLDQRQLDDQLSSAGAGAGQPRGFHHNTEALLQGADIVVLTNGLVYGGYGHRHGRLLYNNRAFGRFGVLRAQPQAQQVLFSPAVLERNEAPHKFADGPLKFARQPPVPPLRVNFAETWLWQNGTTGGQESGGGGGGRLAFKARIPDTITSWRLSAFSLNEAHGFALASVRPQVRVFKPFFVKLHLPHSLIRGETVNLQAVVFNYNKRPLTARVTLDNKLHEFDFVEPANSIEDEQLAVADGGDGGDGGGGGQQSRTVRVPAEQGVSVSFLVRPRKLGYIDIRCVARSELAADGLVKKLLVKPEGQVQRFNRAQLLSLPGPQTVVRRNVSVEVPANAVPGSQRVAVSLVGDVLGAGLANVDDLLLLPYGCGEQNMINLVPNIVLLNYLQSSGRLREAQRAKALRNIQAGYQRQLKYRRSDGSFSAFGESDPNGSVWLTAYVLKTLQQAKSIGGGGGLTVDESVIRAAGQYLVGHVELDGSVRESGMMHSKSLASSASALGRPLYLTAYTMIALLQRPIELEPQQAAGASVNGTTSSKLNEIINRGLDYLERQLEEMLHRGGRGGEQSASPVATYELIISTYALQLAARQPAAQETSGGGGGGDKLTRQAYERIWSLAHSDPKEDLVWWTNSSPATATATNDPEEAVELASSGAGAGAGAASGERESNLSPRSVASSSGRLQVSAGAGAPAPPLRQPPVDEATRQSAHLHVPDALAVEMSSLVLLTAVKRAELDRALPIVRWLISQQNAQGGFASTQDTVLAIEALAAFAEANSAGPSRPLSIDVELIYPKKPRRAAASGSALLQRNNVDQLLVSQSNALVQQTVRLEQAPGEQQQQQSNSSSSSSADNGNSIHWVQLVATGQGMAVVQVSWQYNLLVSAERPAFYLNPILDKASTIDYLQLSVCTYYKAPGEASSNMAVAEVELPSGYVADAEALPGLRRHPSIRRVDTADAETRVLVYLDRVTREELCFTVPAHRSTKVSNNQPVPVTIYDYYDRKQAARIFYRPQLASSCDICDPATERAPGSCGQLCASSGPKSGQLVAASLHEQRRQKLAAPAGPSANLVVAPRQHNNNSSTGTTTTGNSANLTAAAAAGLLPLAPVYMTLVSTVRALY